MFTNIDNYNSDLISVLPSHVVLSGERQCKVDLSESTSISSKFDVMIMMFKV